MSGPHFPDVILDDTYEFRICVGSLGEARKRGIRNFLQRSKMYMQVLSTGNVMHMEF